MLPSEYLNDLGYRSRFEQEAQLIATLEHEAIVPVYEYGVESGQPYIVMQYMPGDSLSNRLLHGPLSPEQTGRVLSRIANALDYAHSKGIIHRDLKTSNILFEQDDNAYLADFGIALHAESTWQRNLASGTPAYMSPEQALRKEAIDARSDIYSGIITFEMLTGELPLTGICMCLSFTSISTTLPHLSAQSSPICRQPLIQFSTVPLRRMLRIVTRPQRNSWSPTNRPCDRLRTRPR
jgi:serine/threonine protein kinase